MRLIDADRLIKDRVENDPVRIAVMCEPTVFALNEIIEKIVEKQIDIQDKLYRAFDEELAAALRGELRGISYCLDVIKEMIYENSDT